MDDPSRTKGLSFGREAYYDEDSNTIVITDPNSKDGGTVFRPPGGKKKGLGYFNRLR